MNYSSMFRCGWRALLLTTMLGVTSFFAYAVTPKDFGAKGDVVILKDGYIVAGSATLATQSAKFATSDVGKAIVVAGAGQSGTALVSKIKTVNSPQQVTLEIPAVTNKQDAIVYYGSDDTKAIRECVYKGTTKGGECTINDGVTFLVSNSTSTITPFGAGNNPIKQGTINGTGRIIFAPQEPLNGGTNDRLFYITSQETHPMRVAAGPINKGYRSFKAADAADASVVTAGDWILVTERDSVVKDHVYADWMQVASVDGTTINTTTPFRMTFPNLRPWSGPPSYWGLAFRKAGPVTSNIKIQDITIVIPKRTHAILAIGTRDTRGTSVTGIKCQDASGNCFAGYMDQGLIFRNNVIGETTYSEFAAIVDSDISGNSIDEPGSGMTLPGPPVTGGLEIDFGTAFSTVADNRIGPTRQVCILLSPGIHDTVVRGNSCGIVNFGTGSNCILCRGCYRVTATENSCAGGNGNSHGIDFSDATFAAPMYSDNNKVTNNRVQGFANAYACGGGHLRTDVCDHGR